MSSTFAFFIFLNIVFFIFWVWEMFMMIIVKTSTSRLTLNPLNNSINSLVITILCVTVAGCCCSTQLHKCPVLFSASSALWVCQSLESHISRVEWFPGASHLAGIYLCNNFTRGPTGAQGSEINVLLRKFKNLFGWVLLLIQLFEECYGISGQTFMFCVFMRTFLSQV